MWVHTRAMLQLGNVLVHRKGRDIGSLLNKVLPETQEKGHSPGTCPECHAKLVKKSLPYFEFFVRACPNQHGSWVSSEVSHKIRYFIQDQSATLSRKRLALKAALASFVLIFGVQVFFFSPYFRGGMATAVDKKINIQNWPQRISETYYPLPVQESSISRQEELAYFNDWVFLLNEGISNRMNIDGVLKTKRTDEEYWELYDIYAQRQKVLLAQLESMEVPERLQGFHEKIMFATRDQMEFYGVFTDQKVTRRSTKLRDMLKDPALKASSGQLHGAYTELRELYPDLDHASNLAIESRLCWYDII